MLYDPVSRKQRKVKVGSPNGEASIESPNLVDPDSDDDLDIVESEEIIHSELLNSGLSAGTIRFNQIKDMALKKATKYGYRRKIIQLVTWLIANHPDAVDHESVPQIPVLPIRCNILTEYLGTVCQHTEADGSSTTLTYSTVSGHVSAIKNLYKQHGLTLDDVATLEIAGFLAGVKRDVATKKRDGAMPLIEGKTFLKFEAFRLLAETMLKATTDFKQASITHTMMVLQWNNGCRATNIANLLYHCITMDGDSMVVNLPFQKNDPEGAHSYPRHVFHSDIPELSPFLALGIHEMCRDHRSGDSVDTTMFGLSGVEQRYGKGLGKYMVSKKEELAAMGIDVTKLGMSYHFANLLVYQVIFLHIYNVQGRIRFARALSPIFSALRTAHRYHLYICALGGLWASRCVTGI